MSMRKPISLLLSLLLTLIPASCTAKEPEDPPVTEPTVFFSGTEEQIEQNGTPLYLASMNLPYLRMPEESNRQIEAQINEILSILCTDLLTCPVDRELLISRYESDKAHFRPISRQITVEVTCLDAHHLSLLFRSETIGGGISASYEVRGLTLPLASDPAPLSLAQALQIPEDAALDRMRNALMADIAAHPHCYDLADPENPPLDQVGFVLDGKNGAWIFLSEGIAPGMMAPMIPLSSEEIESAA